jgi:Zn-dependent metalloprotease
MNPSDLSEYLETTEDQGGVHFNSTIASHAGYLMSDGAHGITPLGPELTARIWYRALSRYLTAHAGFADAADATISAARDLRQGEPSVRAAWAAVGVLR